MTDKSNEDNVLSMNKGKKFPKEGELAARIIALIDEYAGELSLVSTVGILEIVKSDIILQASN